MAEKAPAVSVIIPTYNSSTTLRIAIECVLAQDLDDFEAWVIGDGCTDDSAEVVSSFGDGRLNWLNLPVNSGTPSRPRNEALRRASGRYIAYLGHDDIWFPWHLSGLLRSAESGGGDLVYSQGVFIEPGGVVNTFSITPDPWGRGELLTPSNWLHGKELIERIGPWPENVKAFVDREFLERVLRSGAKLGYHSELSVIKFPAAAWRLYAEDSALPQEKYMEAMRQSPSGLKDEVLRMHASYKAAREGLTGNDSGSTLKRALIGIADLYGRHRWPVNGLLYRRQQWMNGLTVKPAFLARIFRIIG